MQREGPHLCFYRHAQYETRFAVFAPNSKVDEIRQKIATTMLRERVKRKKLEFFTPGGDSASIFVDFGRLGVPPGIPERPFRLPGAVSGCPGVLQGRFGVTSGAPRGDSSMLPRRPWDARTAPGPILERLWVEFGCPGRFLEPFRGRFGQGLRGLRGIRDLNFAKTGQKRAKAGVASTVGIAPTAGFTEPTKGAQTAGSPPPPGLPNRPKALK